MNNKSGIPLFPLFTSDKILGKSIGVYNNVFNLEDLDLLTQDCAQETLRESSVIHKSENVKSQTRSSQITFLDHRKEMYTGLYESISNLINEVNIEGYHFNLSLLEPLQYTEYDESYLGHYDAHQDASMETPYYGTTRKLSFSLLLNDEKEFSGGEFQVQGTNSWATIEMRKNTIIFFPSLTWHRVTPVTKGKRKTIVGWVRGPAWK